MTRQYDSHGRDQINIESVQGAVMIQGREPPARSRTEALLLQAVKQEVESRLAQSLHNAVLINLGKQTQPEQVKRPWDAEVKIGSKPAEPLPAEVSILDVFDQTAIAGRLLILGDPGAGKTTTLLDLAKGLIEQAETQTDYPIPVLFNLSSWKDPRQSMVDWLVEELKSKYGVRKDIGKQWLEAKQLLPLLDGLDEVKPEHQESCVYAINQWLQSETRPMFVTVCSRREEYDSYTTCLELNGAILLQALTDDQIQHYLAEVNRVELWQVLHQDVALRELLHTPLLLSIAVLSYEELSLTQWRQLSSTAQRLEQLLDAYVLRMFHRPLTSQAYRTQTPPSAKQTRQWLMFLAQQLERESQTEFLIEKMQPKKWLLTKGQKWVYSLFAKLAGWLSAGTIGGLIFGLIDELNGALNGGLTFGLSFGLASGLIGGSIVGVISGLSGSQYEIEPIEAIKISMSHNMQQKFLREMYRGLVDWLSAGLTNGLMIGLVVGLIFGMTDGLLFGMIVALSSVLTGGLISGLVGGLKIDIETRLNPNQGIWNSAKNAGAAVAIASVLAPIYYSLLSYLLSHISHILSERKISGIVGLSITGLIVFGYLEGGKACIRHFSLRWVLFSNGLIPWNYACFLDYCTERLLLQRVGGRYRFIHKLLQDHFARMGE